jgi:hypothetical protein
VFREAKNSFQSTIPFPSGTFFFSVADQSARCAEMYLPGYLLKYVETFAYNCNLELHFY